MQLCKLLLCMATRGKGRWALAGWWGYNVTSVPDDSGVSFLAGWVHLDEHELSLPADRWPCRVVVWKTVLERVDIRL